MPVKPGALAVGNFDSNVGYAWRLMERLWCDLAEHCSRRGYEMHLCFPTVSTIPNCLTQSGYQVHQLDFRNKSFKSLWHQLAFLRRNSIALVYLTDAETVSIRYLFFRLTGVKHIIVHDHTPGVRTRPRFFKWVVKRLINSMPGISASGCFAVSPYVAKRLNDVNGVPAWKVFDVTNGVDIKNFPFFERKPGKTITIVTVARANYYKGIDFAIKTMAEIIHRRGFSGVRYVLYGDGPDLDTFKKMVTQLGLDGFVLLAGPVDDVPTRLLTCDIAFHPSRGEAMSLAILEYMRAALPTVVSDNPSVSSALSHKDNAIIYQEGSVESAADALSILITNEEVRLKIGRSARRTVENEFSSLSMSKRFISSVEGLIG